MLVPIVLITVLYAESLYNCSVNVSAPSVSPSPFAVMVILAVPILFPDEFLPVTVTVAVPVAATKSLLATVVPLLPSIILQCIVPPSKKFSTDKE